MPERTIKVPNKLNAKATIAIKIPQALNAFRFSITIKECSKITPANQGMKEAFSTGSQNHHPPHPNWRYAHQLPNTIPIVKKHQAANVNIREKAAQRLSRS